MIRKKTYSDPDPKNNHIQIRVLTLTLTYPDLHPDRHIVLQQYPAAELYIRIQFLPSTGIRIRLLI